MFWEVCRLTGSYSGPSPFWEVRGTSHSVKSSAPRALAGGKNGRLTLRATAGYCFSPLFGLLRTSPGFTALHPCNLKARDSKGDRGNFPCETRVRESLGFKSPRFCNFLFPVVPFTSKAKNQTMVCRALCLCGRVGLE